jgi:hypothetical protein
LKSATSDLVIGAIPSMAINRALGLELADGSVVLSRGAQRHALKRHPKDYALCLPHLSVIVTSPLYVGDDFKNSGKIELVGRLRAAAISILVAVNVERNARGQYQIASFYPVSEDKIENRRRRGFLKPA